MSIILYDDMSVSLMTLKILLLWFTVTPKLRLPYECVTTIFVFTMSVNPLLISSKNVSI